LPGSGGTALRALQHGLSHAIAALCAELTGSMEKSIETTVEYLKNPPAIWRDDWYLPGPAASHCRHGGRTRTRPIDDIRPSGIDTQQRVVSQTKAFVGRAAKAVCSQAIQLHGGMGMTEECAIGHYFKRAVVADILFGTSDQHEAACATALQRNVMRAHCAK
jgi:alkylation response protein AidB-like acyl-CoA dehydrogenase